MSDRERQPALFWLDMEMTGLDAAVDRLLEVAVIVTGHDFGEREVFETVVFQPPEVLESMNEWCQRHHRENGLLERVCSGIDEAAVDQQLADLVERHWSGIPAILCGNSIHQDRKFVDRYLPRLAGLLHYRMLDVSAFKVAYNEFIGEPPPKKGSHRALDDIRESITEFRFYLERFSGNTL